MNNKAALIQALLHPLAISQRGWRALAVAAAKADLSSPLVPGAITKPTEAEENGVAIIDIDGPLSKDSSILQLFFGGTSYASIRNQLELALADDTVSAIVLNVNSPGGEVYGCSELANYIYDVRDQKPIHAYISGQGDSAAYWLASAASHITINATAEAGSIGVRCALVDDSEFLQSLGIKEYDIVADQSPLKVVDPSKAEDRARVKAQMTDFAAVFIDDVAKARSVSTQKVLGDFGRGDVLVGEAAVKAGLADDVGTLDDVITNLAITSSNNKEIFMKLSEKNAALAAAAATPAAGMSNGKCSKCKADMDDGDPAYCKGCMDGGGKAESFIKDVCALTGTDSPAAAMGALVAAKSKLEAALAAADELAKAKAELETLRAEHAKKEVASIIDEAIKGGVAPAKRGELESLADKYGVEALKVALSVAGPVATTTPAQPPKTDETAIAAAKKNAEAAPAPAWTQTGELSPDQLKMLKALNMTPEQFIQAHKTYTVAMNGGVDKE